MCCCCKIGTFLFNVIQFVALACAIIGTLFDQFRPSNSKLSDNTDCITIWGIKDKCYGADYVEKMNAMWQNCPERRTAFRVAQVCSVITCALLLVGLVFGILNSCCVGRCCKIIAQILDVGATLTAIVVFATMLDSWNNRRGPENEAKCGPLKDEPYRIGAGLALMVCAAGLAFINIFIGLIPC